MGKRVLFVPIEPLEERYSAQWYSWFMRDFERCGCEVLTVGDRRPATISVGQFLDVYGTSEYKARQMVDMIRLIRDGFEGTIFFMDLWFPGLCHLGYLRDNARRRIKLSGMLHAGTWDKWDYLSQNGLTPWAQYSERGWLTMVDQVFVATEYHRQLVLGARGVAPVRIEVARFPVIDARDCPRCGRNTEREALVVFPHRLAPEKDVGAFYRMRDLWQTRYGREHDAVEWLLTKRVCGDKAAYYALLSRATVAVSTAKQETFGIAMQEAVNCGAVPVVPDRLSYQELFSDRYRYDDLAEGAELVQKALEGTLPPMAPETGSDVRHIVEAMI